MWRLWAPAFLYALTLLVMVVSAVREPAVQPSGTDTYGENFPGDLARMLLFATAELAIYLALVRPWSYRRAWWRTLGTLALFSPWLLASIIAGHHSGSVVATHVLWLSILWLGLALETLWSATVHLAERLGLRDRAV